MQFQSVLWVRVSESGDSELQPESSTDDDVIATHSVIIHKVIPRLLLRTEARVSWQQQEGRLNDIRRRYSRPVFRTLVFLVNCVPSSRLSYIRPSGLYRHSSEGMHQSFAKVQEKHSREPWEHWSPGQSHNRAPYRYIFTLYTTYNNTLYLRQERCMRRVYQ
jgi:hypothetical protein